MSSILEIQVTDLQIENAKRQAVAMGRLNKSITKGQGNVAGFLGEIVFADIIGASQNNTYEYDVVMSDGSTVDVKTKRTTVAPQPHYDCSVAALNTRQKCDYYAFMRVKNDYSKAWFLGMIRKDTYFDKSRFLKKGEIDPDNNFTVKSDCYNLSISDLWEQFSLEFG
jgi:hypothetical protein